MHMVPPSCRNCRRGLQLQPAWSNTAGMIGYAARMLTPCRGSDRVARAVHLRDGQCDIDGIKRQSASIGRWPSHDAVLLRIAGQIVHQHHIVIALKQPVTPPLHSPSKDSAPIRLCTESHWLTQEHSQSLGNPVCDCHACRYTTEACQQRSQKSSWHTCKESSAWA